jgi:hypothetical protein
MPDAIRQAESAHTALMTSVTDGIKQLKESERALLGAARFARSVLKKNGTWDLSERMAVEKLDKAIALAEARRQ